jgi:hypothetical protein
VVQKSPCSRSAFANAKSPNRSLQLADRLRENGAQFSPRVLEIMSGAMSFLEATGNPVDDDVATAAYAASQLMSDDAKKAAAALAFH